VNAGRRHLRRHGGFAPWIASSLVTALSRPRREAASSCYGFTINTQQRRSIEQRADHAAVHRQEGPLCFLCNKAKLLVAQICAQGLIDDGGKRGDSCQRVSDKITRDNAVIHAAASHIPDHRDLQ